MKRTNTAKWMEKQNRWQINVQKDGVRRTFTSSKPGRTGQREANAKADAWLDQGIVNGSLRISTLADEWEAELKETSSTSHHNQYEGFIRLWIKPIIGNVKVSNLNNQHLQNVINAAYKHGLSKKSLSNIQGCLSAFVKYLRKRKATMLIVEDVTIPRQAPVGKRTILQPKDLKILFSSDESLIYGKTRCEIYINAYRFEVLTGLRPGEVIGLKWEDISDECVHVQRSFNKYNELTTRKNENARRVIPLTKLSKYILILQKKLLNENQIVSKFVFANEYGEHISYHSYYKRWINYRTYHELSSASPYELRHTFVSIAKTLPEGLIKSYVGHSKDMDTFGVYGHEVSGEMQQTADLLEDVFTKVIK